jgi:serine/threonine protein kinase
VTERLVAIKVIKAQFAHDPEFAQRFHREAQAASQVPAFCTARVLDAGADANRPFLVTEFIAGPTLEAAVETNGPLAPSDLEGLAVGMAAALSAIHSANIIHRDLKPSNVLLSPVGPRVIDFGVARPLEAAKTHSNLLIGTPAFMPPERFTGTGIGPTTDIFAWGGVLAYASSGEPPFGDGDMTTLMYRVIDHEPRPARPHRRPAGPGAAGDAKGSRRATNSAAAARRPGRPDRPARPPYELRGDEGAHARGRVPGTAGITGGSAGGCAWPIAIGSVADGRAGCDRVAGDRPARPRVAGTRAAAHRRRTGRGRRRRRPASGSRRHRGRR